MEITKVQRVGFGLCGFGLVILTIMFPEGNMPLDFFFGVLGFVYLLIAILAEDK